jgi:hypothetical protein
VTAAALPDASVAENCWTDVPLGLVALQPVQLVSIETVPGERVKVALEGSALTPPPAQPATTTRAGKRIAARRSGMDRMRAGSGTRAACEAGIAICAPRSKMCSWYLKGLIQFRRETNRFQFIRQMRRQTMTV